MKKKIDCFEDLFIWQKAIEFAKEIYLLTEKNGLKNDYGLKGQMPGFVSFNLKQYRRGL